MVDGGVVRDLPSESYLPRVHGNGHTTRSGARRPTRCPPPSSVTSVSPSDPGPRFRASRFAPVKLATNGSLGEPTRSCGDPSWSTRPSTSTPTRSARVAASSKSCVTSSVGIRSSRRNSCNSARTAAPRVSVERRERLVEKQHVGSACERAGKCDPLALTARELARARGREAVDAKALEELGNGSPIARAEGDVSRVRRGAERARTPGRRARPRAARAARRCRVHGRATSRRRDLTNPRSGRRRPATVRRTLDFPAPDGPTSATVSAPTASVSSRRKARRP